MGLPPRRRRHSWRSARWRMRRARVVLTERRVRTGERTDAARCQRSAHRRLRNRLRDPQSHLDLPVHRHGAPGGRLPRQTRAAGRRRRARASPVGGQGLNIGVQDAVNLGWKLAQVIKRTSPESLLDTYHAERHPVAARALRNTMAQVALRRPDDRTKALGDYVSELLAHGRASQTNGRGDVRSGHSLRPRRGTSAARTPHARSRPGHRHTVRCGSSPCCTMPGRCCSTSASPAASTSLRGQIGSGWSTPSTSVRGSFRHSGRSRLPAPC